MNSQLNSVKFWSTGLQRPLRFLCKAALSIRLQSISFCCDLTTFTQSSLEHFKEVSEVGHPTITRLHAEMKSKRLLCILCVLWFSLEGNSVRSSEGATMNPTVPCCGQQQD